MKSVARGGDGGGTDRKIELPLIQASGRGAVFACLRVVGIDDRVDRIPEIASVSR